MSWYYTFIDLLLVAFIGVMARHLYLRARFFLHIFQLKGYKFGEYAGWLKENWNERVFTVEHTLFLIVIFSLAAFLSEHITGSTASIVLSVIGIFWFGPANFYQDNREKKPLVMTPRARRLMIPFGIFTIFFPLLGIQLSYMNGLLGLDIYILAFGWVMGDLCTPFFIFLAGGLTYPIERSIHSYYKRKAKYKVENLADLTVIGITGSYGKTSTKFMIRDLLQERYSVCATPASYNTPMGICKVINNTLKAHHQVFIVEMGARYEGNIKELCDLVQPDIAVVTNVGIAHLETFKTVDNIAETKAELIDNMKSGGLAILNADDERVSAMGKYRKDIDVKYTGIENGDLQASNVRYDERGTTFTVSLGEKKSTKVQMKLLGKHNVQNMLQAMAIADYFGLRLETMKIAARKMKPVEHRLELKKEGELYVIDDAFNSNPVGAKNAVDILSQFDTGRRIVVTPGMIELGEREDEENYKLGRYIGEAYPDLVILVGEDRVRRLQEGLRDSGFPGEKVKKASSLFAANSIIRDYATGGDVILYENDLPDTY